MPFVYVDPDPIQLPPIADSTVIGFSTADAPVVTLGHYVVGKNDTVWPDSPARTWKNSEEVFCFHEAHVRAEALVGHRRLKMTRKNSDRDNNNHPVVSAHRNLLAMINSHTGDSAYQTAKTVFSPNTHWWVQLPQGATLPASSVSYSTTMGGKTIYLSLEYADTPAGRSLRAVRWLMHEDPADHSYRLPMGTSGDSWILDPIAAPAVGGWYCEQWNILNDRS